MTPLPSWGGLGKAGAVLDGESQRPWGTSSTVRWTRVETRCADRMDLAGGVQGAGRGRMGVGQAGLYLQEAAKRGVGMYQVEKLGEMASCLALG